MFGSPQSQPTSSGARYYVPLRAPPAMGLRLSLPSPGAPVAVLADQPAFKALQARLLAGLVHHTQLFKTPPSLESLISLSPPFGPVVLPRSEGGATVFSPTATFRHDPSMKTPCFVDLVVEGLYVSRTCISPVFSTRFLEPVSAVAEVLDFADDGLEELSDLPEVADSNPMVLLVDPVVAAREKAAKKQAVKEAFLLATAAKERAVERAHAFLEEYDLSDNESGFSEFLDEEDEEDEDEEEGDETA